MMRSKLLKVKKWVDLNEAAMRLSIALDEPVNALDLMELALDDELILSVKLPFDKKYVARKMWRKYTPMGERLRELFQFENFFSGGGKNKDDEDYIKKENEYLMSKYIEFLEANTNSDLSEEQKKFDFYCNSIKMPEWEYGEIDYLEGSIYELSMLGSEHIDVMWLIQKNKEMEMDELTNLDGVILRDSGGDLYNLQEKVDEDYINSRKDDEHGKLGSQNKIIKRFRLNPRHYFPAGGLPAGCELGMSPANMSKFEAKLSESDTDIHVSENQLLVAMGAVLNEITTSGAKKWTQGDLAARIGDKKILNLGERAVNGIFSCANKAMKSVS
ncbi:conserved hypothetical protein [Enterobacterales bacterium 8AC]|nr:conserved hypothetical protein [Enterobacterales bacterium 8AC]